jgi:hypothetical protein
MNILLNVQKRFGTVCSIHMSTDLRPMIIGLLAFGRARLIILGLGAIF